MTIANLTATLGAIRDRRELPIRLTAEDVRSLKKLADPLKSNTTQILVGDIPIDTEFTAGCDLILLNAPRSLGQAIGRLEGLNTHDQYFFRIYPTGTNRGAQCFFAQEKYDEVYANMRKRVRVEGLIHRDPDGIGIDRITEISLIESLPEDSQLPTMASLLVFSRIIPSICIMGGNRKLTRLRVCLDSSVWGGIFNQDQPKHQISLGAIVDEFDKGKISILIPSVVVTEVAAGPDRSKINTLLQFATRTNVEQIDITTTVAVEAGLLRRNIQNSVRWKLKTLDALIVAAANHFRADVIVSCDDGIARLDGQFGLTPKICTPNDYFSSVQPLFSNAIP